MAHWASERKLYALGRAWMEHSVGMWNAPQTPMSPDALQAMRALMEEVVQSPAEEVSVPGDVSLQSRLRMHLEGALVAPWMVMLGTALGTDAMTSWDDVERATSQLHPELQEAWGEVMHALGWADTGVGVFFLERAAAYGVTTSYTQPSFGPKNFSWARALALAHGTGEAEIHVDRTLNVWGSGGAHRRTSPTWTRWSRRCSMRRWSRNPRDCATWAAATERCFFTCARSLKPKPCVASTSTRTL